VGHTARFTLLCADMTGVLAAGAAEVEKAFAEALGSQGIVPGTTAFARSMVQVHQASGQAGIDVFRQMFPGDEARAQVASLTFDRSFAAAIDRGALSPVAGADVALAALTSAGLRLCLVSEYSRQLSVQAIDALGWQDRFDLIVSSDDYPRGCPWPDPVLTAMLRHGAGEVREIAVAAGTECMVRAGSRAGAGLVAGVLSGPHSETRLRDAGATHLVASIAELPAVVAAPGAERAS
jgi:phosphoglycolate phosphatase